MAGNLSTSEPRILGDVERRFAGRKNQGSGDEQLIWHINIGSDGTMAWPAAMRMGFDLADDRSAGSSSCRLPASAPSMPSETQGRDTVERENDTVVAVARKRNPR